jgi:hypothetical protein
MYFHVWSYKLFLPLKGANITFSLVFYRTRIVPQPLGISNVEVKVTVGMFYNSQKVDD